MSDGSSISGYLQIKENENRNYFLNEKSKYLKELQSEGLFCNCTIDVGGKLFKVHLEILSAASEFFDSIIRRDSDSEDVVALHNMTPEIFQIILNYLYTGCVNINSSNIVDIYVAADFLILNSLLGRCRVFFRNAKNEDFEAGVTIVCLYNDEIIFKHLSRKHDFLNRKDLLQQLGVEYFFKALQYRERVSFVDEGIMQMGSYYIQKVQSILSDVFPEETRVVTKEDCVSSLYFVPYGAAESELEVATMPTYDNSVDYIGNTWYSPWKEFPPDIWTISKIIFYIIPIWGGTKGLVGGADVEYRNIWTGERKMNTSPFTDFLPSSYTKEVLELEEGETLNGFIINTGWLVDKMIFTTSKGRQLGPYGHSRGGDRKSVNILKERNVEINGTSSKKAFMCLALHGFSFNLIGTDGCRSWYNIRFIYTCLRKYLHGVKGVKI